jgi:hypothetical protein
VSGVKPLLGGNNRSITQPNRESRIHVYLEFFEIPASVTWKVSVSIPQPVIYYLKVSRGF